MNAVRAFVTPADVFGGLSRTRPRSTEHQERVVQEMVAWNEQGRYLWRNKEVEKRERKAGKRGPELSPPPELKGKDADDWLAYQLQFSEGVGSMFQARELSDDEVEKMLAELDVEFERKWGTPAEQMDRALSSAPPSDDDDDDGGDDDFYPIELSMSTGSSLDRRRAGQTWRTEAANACPSC